MKKALSVLLAAGILGSMCAVSIGSAAANGTESSVQELAAGIALKYTGQKDEQGFPTDWSGDDLHELKKIGNGTSNATGSFQVKWDEEAVYVKAVIADATHDTGNDQIKFLLDLDGKPAGEAAVNFGGTNAVNAGVYTWNGAAYYVGNADPANAYGGGSNEGVGSNILNTPGIKIDYAEGKYTVLALLKVNDGMKAKLANNSEIGFDIRWNDFNGAASETDEKMTTFGWASSQAKWNTDLREIGSITLLNERPAPPAPAEPAKATAIYGTPEMDGKLNEWTDVPANEFKNATDNKDITGSFKLMWDEEAIYVAVQVTDEEEDSSLIKVLFNMDGVPVGEERVMLGESAPLAAVYSVNWEGYGFGYVPNNAGFSYSEGAKGYGDTHAGNDILDSAMNIFAAYPTTYELKYTFNEEAKAKLVENAKIGFDIMYLDSFGNTNTSDLHWTSTEGKETFGLDLRDAGEVTLAPAPAVEPLEPTEGAPKAVTPGKEDIASTTVNLKWTTADGAAGYDVLVFKVSGSGDNREYTFLKKETVAGSTLTLTNLDPGTEYAFQLLAADENGERVAVYEMIYATTLLSDGEQSDGGFSSEPDDSTESDNSGSGDSPDTGHTSALFVVLGMLSISTAALYLLRRKRQD